MRLHCINKILSIIDTFMRVSQTVLTWMSWTSQIWIFSVIIFVIYLQILLSMCWWGSEWFCERLLKVLCISSVLHCGHAPAAPSSTYSYVKRDSSSSRYQTGSEAVLCKGLKLNKHRDINWMDKMVKLITLFCYYCLLLFCPTIMIFSTSCIYFDVL